MVVTPCVPKHHLELIYQTKLYGVLFKRNDIHGLNSPIQNEGT